jgi:hypothetical protein
VLGVYGSQLIESLRVKTTRTKRPVLAINFRVLMPSAAPYLNPICHPNKHQVKVEDAS